MGNFLKSRSNYASFNGSEIGFMRQNKKAIVCNFLLRFTFLLRKQMKGTEEAGVWEGLAGGWGGEQSFFEAGGEELL